MLVFGFLDVGVGDNGIVMHLRAALLRAAFLQYWLAFGKIGGPTPTTKLQQGGVL